MSTQPTFAKELIRPAELARRLGIARITLERWAKRGRIPQPYRIGVRAVAFDVQEVEEWLRQRRRG